MVSEGRFVWYARKARMNWFSYTAIDGSSDESLSIHAYIVYTFEKYEMPPLYTTSHKDSGK